MTELLQLDPGEIEELASECAMRSAFRQRLVYAHQVLRTNNRDRIRQLAEGGLDMDTARRRALEDWSRMQPWNQRSPSMKSKSDPFGRTKMTEAARKNAPTREIVA